MEYRKIIIKLDKYLKTHHISRNSLSRSGELRYDTILNYCREEVTPLDTDTLAKLCHTLNCEISDIIEYKKYNNKYL